MFFLIFFSGGALAQELRDLFWRADGETVKLTFKFTEGTSWVESSPDPYHIVVDVEGATNSLGYNQRPMGIGPLRNIMFVEKDGVLRLWVELREKVDYEIYDEAGGRLISMVFHMPPGKGEERLFSFDFRNAEVRDVLLALAQAAGVNIVVDDSVTGTISVSFENLTFDQALGYIMTMKGLGQIKLGNNIVVADRNILEENFDLLETRRFELKYIDPEKAKETLSLVISESGRIITDKSSRAIIVRGRAEELSQAEKMLKEIDHPLEVKTFYLSNNLYREEEDLEKIKNLLKIVIPEEDRVGFDAGQKAIVVKGTPEEIEAASQLLKNLDRKRPQIMVDVKLVEVDRQKVKDLGFGWEVGGVTGAITFGELSLGGSMERQNLVEVTLNALTRENKAHIVGNPRILTLSGEKATINVGDKIPYRNIQSIDEAGNVIPGGVEFLEVGVKLEVTPVLTEDHMILVEVKPEVSSSSEREYLLAGQAYTDPQVKTRSAETTARLRSGETLVIGGLIRSEDIEKITRIPILGEIPVIGELFVLRNKTHEETELVIFITPHLIETVEDGLEVFEVWPEVEEVVEARELEMVEAPLPVIELPTPVPVEPLVPVPVTYTLILDGEGLSSTPEAKEIAANTPVTITVTPPEGKQLVALVVNNEDRTDELVENKYTFTITSDTRVIAIYEDIPDPEAIAIEELKDRTTLDVMVADGVIMVTVEYPDFIDPILDDWMVDTKLTLGNALPKGTTVDVKYNGTSMASGVRVSGTQIYLSELLPKGKRQSITACEGEMDVWEIAVYPGDAVDTAVTVEAVISKDDFAHEKVIAWGRGNLKIDPEAIAIEELKDRTTLDVMVADGVIMVTVEYPDFIDPILDDWMVDTKLTLGNALPKGTTVDVKYNGTSMASGVRVSGTQIYLSELLPKGKRQSITACEGEMDVWEIAVYPGDAVDTAVTVEAVISKDDFAHEKVIAWGRGNLKIPM